MTIRREHILGRPLNQTWPTDALGPGSRVVVVRAMDRDGPWQAEFAGTVDAMSAPELDEHVPALDGELDRGLERCRGDRRVQRARCALRVRQRLTVGGPEMARPGRGLRLDGIRGLRDRSVGHGRRRASGRVLRSGRRGRLDGRVFAIHSGLSARTGGGRCGNDEYGSGKRETVMLHTGSPMAR